MTRLYLAMQSGFDGRSLGRDGWSRTATRPAEHLECVTAHPTRPDRILLGTFTGGCLRSENGGHTFERIGENDIEADAVTSVTIDPNDPDHVLVGTEPSRLYRSTDGGDAWMSIETMTSVPSRDDWSFPPRPETHHVRWIAMAPDDPERWYVGVEAGALLVTPDAGETWIDRPDGSRRDVHWLATHPDAPNRVYAAAGDGYAESLDRGESWVHPSDGLDHRYVWSVAVDPGNPDVRFVSAANGPREAHRPGTADAHVYRRRGNDPWERMADLPHGDGVVRAVLASGRQPGHVYAATNHGIHHTADAGESWDRVSGEWPERFRDEVPRGLAVVPG